MLEAIGAFTGRVSARVGGGPGDGTPARPQGTEGFEVCGVAVPAEACSCTVLGDELARAGRFAAGGAGVGCLEEGGQEEGRVAPGFVSLLIFSLWPRGSEWCDRWVPGCEGFEAALLILL